jgi:hypothetical protein
MAPEATREDARGFDRRRIRYVGQRYERPNRDPPTPAHATWVILGDSYDLDDGEDRLPSGRVTDGQVAPLDAGSPCGRVPLQ